MEHIKHFKAADGTIFPTREQCKNHEYECRLRYLVALDIELIKEALDGSRPLIADALEFAGAIVANLRRSTGNFKRNVVAKRQ